MIGPAGRPLKRATRNVWWRWKGRTISNPPIPRGVTSVLFVCLGNICRSPFAEAIASRRASALGAAVRFSSAGLKTKPAAEPPLDARRAAETYDISLSGYRPIPLTRELIDNHDLIVVMEPTQREQLCAAHPDAAGRVLLLSFFDDGASGFERYCIVDPFGLPAAAYQHCYQRIDRAVASLLSAIMARPRTPEAGTRGGSEPQPRRSVPAQAT